MPSTGDVSAKMVAALRASEPDIDTSVGTPLRKILDAVAESIAEAYVDQHLITYQYDIDSKVGGDLDDFVALFGFSRIAPQRAQGVVTFSRPNDTTAAQTAVLLPPGTQVVALTSPQVYVATTVSAIMNPGQTSTDVPVQAITAGPQGNVAAGLLTQLVQLSGTITGAINANALSGGTAQESDDQLRTRFKQTVFRSLAGTRSMYEAVVRDVPQDPSLPGSKAVSQVNVIGSSRRWREQVQLVSGTATTTLQNAAFIFPDNVFCGTNIDAGSMLTQGVNYSFTPTNPSTGANATATLASLNSSMPDGLYDLEFEYVPQASRNDPGNTRWNQGGINNRIDIWINGLITQTATQSVVFQSTRPFSTTSSNAYYNGKFTQDNDTTPTPPANNLFIPLAYGPILSVPTTLSINGVTYTKGTDYWIAHQSDAFGYTPSSLYGLAWLSTHKPPENAVFSITYNYNQVAYKVRDAIAQWRLVGTDTKVHCGKRVYLKFNLAIMYDRKFDSSSVNTAINNALAAYLGTLGFDAAVQASDILQLAHNVPGVDNVRFLTSTDSSTAYSIQRMSSNNGSTLSTYSANGRVIDIQFADDQYPVFHSTNLVAKAANTFMTGA